MGRTRAKALVIAALGARGTGKSAWAMQLLDQLAPARLIVWDPMNEYHGHGDARANLGDVIHAMDAPTWQLVFRPAPGRWEQQFDLLCRAVKAAKDCVLLVDELAMVTKPQKAPPAWRELVLLGRHWNVTVIGLSGRPGSIDKDFIGMCDVVHSGRLLVEGDARAVSPFIGCAWQDLAQLQDLHYIERRVGQGEPLRGQVTFTKKSSTTKTRANGTAPLEGDFAKPRVRSAIKAPSQTPVRRTSP